MDRVPGHAWLMVLAAAVLLTVASAVPLAPSHAPQASSLSQDVSLLSLTAVINPWRVTGHGALVITGVLLLLFIYRRRLYILFWTSGWFLLSASMFLAGRPFLSQQAGELTYGVSQFLGILSALFFVISADAYPARPKLRRGYALVLVAVLLWFALAPLGLGTWAVFAPGHILIAGALGAAGVGHLILLRQARMLGAAIVGVALLMIAASHIWIVVKVGAPGSDGTTHALVFAVVLYLIAALGMQLMTFEDMTWELRRTNRRLEAAQAKLRRMVITDPLTGCRNRRFFDEIIGRELQRHRRYDIPMSIVFVDVDRFKAINDTLGHDAGDRVLREVAAFLLSNIREADYVFRWGGDEFLILLSCEEDEALSRALALQSDFGRYAIAASLPAGVGLSIGCSEVAPDASNVMSVIKVADERMYDNKRTLRRAGRPQQHARANGTR